jgi:SAM-dependent methyltransferase
MTDTATFDPALLAQLYDQAMEDWPGEWDFYLGLASELQEKTPRILEIGCGTGRIAIRLAQQGYLVTGLDNSQSMLDLARQKSQSLTSIRWMMADMQNFELGEVYDLAIIPGHSFQFMATVEAQLECLACIKAHLRPGSKLVVHVNHDDLEWLAGLSHEPGPKFEFVGEYELPEANHHLRHSQAWSYVRVTQTAISVNLREELADDGKVINSWNSKPAYLHCFFPAEIDHLVHRAGYVLEIIYGDFYKQKLEDNSPSIIPVLRRI